MRDPYTNHAHYTILSFNNKRNKQLKQTLCADKQNKTETSKQHALQRSHILFRAQLQLGG